MTTAEKAGDTAYQPLYSIVGRKPRESSTIFSYFASCYQGAAKIIYEEATIPQAALEAHLQQRFDDLRHSLLHQGAHEIVSDRYHLQGTVRSDIEPRIDRVLASKSGE